MSPTNQDRRDEPRDTEPKPEDSRRGEAEGPKSGKDYVFKIAPADPKNAFDFEDVADK